jgi:hypothetical protein
MERGGRRVVAVGAATGCVAEVGRWYPAGAVGCGDTGSCGAEARRDCVEPLAFAAWLAFPQQTKPPGYPDGFVLEVRTTGVLSKWDSNRFASVPQQKRPEFSASASG